MAIAFDASSFGTSAVGSTLTIAHTASGSNNILWVGIVGSSDTDNVTGVTFKGVAGTRVGTTIFQTRYFYLYYVKGVTGTGNIIVSNSGAGDIYMSASCASYTGASQTGIPDATVQATTASTSVSATITTVADNCFVVGYTAGQGYNVTTIDTGGTIRSQANTSVAIFDSTTAKTPAGSKTMTANWSGSTNHAIILASFAPGAAVVASVSTEKTTQEYLNTKAGTSNLTKQEAINRLAGTTGLTQQEAWNVYASLTPKTGQTTQQAANVKAGRTGLSVQQASSII